MPFFDRFLYFFGLMRIDKAYSFKIPHDGDVSFGLRAVLKRTDYSDWSRLEWYDLRTGKIVEISYRFASELNYGDSPKISIRKLDKEVSGLQRNMERLWKRLLGKEKEKKKEEKK